MARGALVLLDRKLSVMPQSISRLRTVGLLGALPLVARSGTVPRVSPACGGGP